MVMQINIGELFEISKGNAGSLDDYYDIVDEDANTVAYVSASTTRNGINGFVLPKGTEKVFEPHTITVAIQGQGSVAYATLQPHRYIASGLVLSLKPIESKFSKYNLQLSDDTLIIICAMIRKFRWRFSYGRTVDIDRINVLKIDTDKISNVLMLAA